VILFLDFDGVLHPEDSRDEPLFCRLPLLEAWLRERPSVDVVISSTWREIPGLEGLLGFFAPDIRRRVIGVTPVYHRMHALDWGQTSGHPEPPRHKRHVECLRWMHDSSKPTRVWAALDDDASLFDPSCRNLVMCDRRVGLSQAQLDELDRRLQEVS
jgi:hypothetical protein